MRAASAEIEAVVQEGVEAKGEEWREYLAEQKREKQRTGVPNPKITSQPKWSEVEAEVTRKLTAKDRDIVQENAILFLNSAMIYLDLHEVCISNDPNFRLKQPCVPDALTALTEPRTL